MILYIRVERDFNKSISKSNFPSIKAKLQSVTLRSYSEFILSKIALLIFIDLILALANEVEIGDWLIALTVSVNLLSEHKMPEKEQTGSTTC